MSPHIHLTGIRCMTAVAFPVLPQNPQLIMVTRPSAGPQCSKDDALRAYHQQLSLHLTSLLRATSPQPERRPSRDPSVSSPSSSKLSKSASEDTRPTSVTTIEEEPAPPCSPDPIPLPADLTARLEDADVTPSLPASKTSRDEEHRRAWATDGCKAWQAIPDDFQLRLDKSGVGVRVAG